jgi:superfamily II DNA or RNA helicase
MKPSRKVVDMPIGQALPKSVNIVVSNQIFVGKQNLPPALINKIIRLAAFQNPEFYKAQSMRLPTFGKPRIIACAENFPDYIGLPRGCLEETVDLLDSLDVEVIIDDKKWSGNHVKLNFLGNLTDEQQKAAKKLSQHDIGVLAATTAFGKTVVGAYMIAKRKTNTLIIVHRRQLLDQWIERLKIFLDLGMDQIGMIGGGKYKPSGVVDIAIIQSLIKSNVVDDLVAEYGHVIVDECHHLSAVSFEQVIRACKAKYVLGLTATTTRKDGHHPIIFMQCGPIRYKVDAKTQALLRLFNHKIILRNTEFSLGTIKEQRPSISYIYSEIINDHKRNMLIIKDIVQSLKSGCSPLVLTQRKEHAAFFEQHLSQFCQNVIIMVGGQNTKKRAEVKRKLETLSDHEERVIIATGSYIGEGFDDKRLDTLFLTMPISWHGTLAQYAGRLHRAHVHKKEVTIYDYVDNQVAMLARMAEKRLKGYSKIGYVT